MRLDREAFVRGMWPEGLVAAMAVLAVAWPLTTLLRDNTWMLPAVSMVALVAISGAIMRTLDVPPSFIALGQLLLGLVGISQLYLKATLWRGLVPTQDTLEQVGTLLRQAGTVLQTYAAPAPTTQGVIFLVVSVITLTSVSVDSMGVTGRSPASAGIPLAAAFMVSVSNSGRAMAPWFFIAVAVPWLVMIAQQGHRVTRAWPSANRMESHGGADVSAAPRHHRGLSQVLGLLALSMAVLGAMVIPHLPPTFLGDGLARNPDARSVGSDTAQVSFTETMDPSQDLRNPSQAPVLTYRTQAVNLAPLRVTATELFDDGRWVATDRDAGALPPGNQLPPIPGLGQDVPVRTESVQVTGNALPAPHLAAPAPLTAVRLPGDAGFGFAPQDQTVVLRTAAPQYDASYLTLPAGVELPSSVGDAPADPAQFDSRLLSMDPVSFDEVAALSDRVVGGVSNSLEAAVLIQQHLRNGSYRYSLTLAPAAEAGADNPIGGFLETRQGYCVQFATAMVMMARHQGIPARMAVGFLPGTAQPDGTRRVVAADAHTWPELWIEGLGWTRFEPTPGIRAGQPPAYARAEGEPGDEQTATQQVPEPVPTEEPVPEPVPTERTFADDLSSLLPVLGRALLGLLVLALLMAVVPLVGRRYREAGIRSASNRSEQVEGQWLLLTRSLDDLGVDPAPPRSPRTMGRHYSGVILMDSSTGNALNRLTATLERSRYAPSDSLREQDASRMERDVRTVVDSVRKQSPWNVRANARLIPRSGFVALREWLQRPFRRG